jgi:cobalt-zinc-cadmium efflux system membrane fusion protein
MRLRFGRRTWGMVTAAVVVAVGAGFFVRARRSKAVAAGAVPAAAGQPRPLMLPEHVEADLMTTAKVERAALAGDLQVVGSVSPAEDRFAVVGPSVSGRVVRLLAGIGDRVHKGQLLGQIDSTEAGQARGEYIAARAALAAAEANAVRERDLAERQISSNREREVADAQAVSQKAKLRAALAHLRAIGFDASDIARLGQDGAEGVLIPMRAPIDGQVLKRTVTLGQSVERSTDAFTIGDLSSLWVMLDIYEKDLARVGGGQQVNVRTDAAPGEVFKGRVAYVDPVIDEKTRTAHVRVELPNPDGKLRVNQMVTARIIGDAAHAGPPVLTIPRGALQRVDGTPIVFVRKHGAFEKRVIEAGTSRGDRIEVRSGLREGEEIAMGGAFVLKSELLR